MTHLSRGENEPIESSASKPESRPCCGHEGTSTTCCNSKSLTRRDFLRWSAFSAAAATILQIAKVPSVAGPFAAEDFPRLIPEDKKLNHEWVKSLYERGTPQSYSGSELESIGMPVGGICAGQLYLGGDGRLWHWDIFNLPQPQNFCDSGGPNYARPPKPHFPIEQGFAVKATWQGRSETRVLDSRGFHSDRITFRGAYPMAFVRYADPELPFRIDLEAFSPFIPLNFEDSALPATVMNFTVRNNGSTPMSFEIGGWIQNAVCLGRTGSGQRRNEILNKSEVTIVQGTAEPPPAGSEPKPRPDVIFEDFESGYGKWTVTGDAPGLTPPTGTLPNQQRVTGFLGKHLVNTFRNGDVTRGRLKSAPFTIARRYIAFMMGGGSHSQQTCMNLLRNGRVVRSAAGLDQEKLEWREWDVEEFEGEEATLEIVDEATGPWGHINVDQIILTDEPPSLRVPLEARDDFGSMALGVLTKGRSKQGVFGEARLPASAPLTLFSSSPESRIASSKISEKLVGGIGRKFTLAAGKEATVTFVLAWSFPGLLRSSLGPLEGLEQLKRSYANRFKSASDVAEYVAGNFARLSKQTRLWRSTWYDSSLPYWFLDRCFASICTLATNTCYRFNTGRFYAFEGVYCCQGTCQHVWNYAQAVARIFPSLEQDLRARTDFGTAWHEDGAIDYRGECARHVAHDGQCGVILRAWREHQMSADDRFLRQSWPHIRRSIEYMLGQDRDENGLLEGEQYNTLDASWYGPMAWISSFYIAALRAGEQMALAVSDEKFAERCRRVASRGEKALVEKLYNGEYFIHRIDPAHPESTNTNDGCHIDQLMGQAWAWQVGLPRITPQRETLSSLEAIWKYNFTPDVGPFREHSVVKGGRWYAMAGEGGVVMTTFPRGGAEKATGRGGFAHYFNEVWTGQEHQLAAHMLWEGMTDYALVITRMVHDRHHAGRRNPYNEVECSDHYARAMSSYGTFLAACGFEYNGPKAHFGFDPRLAPDNFKAAFTAAEGWGTISQERNTASQTNSISLHWGELKLGTLAVRVPEGKAAVHVEAFLGRGRKAVTVEPADGKHMLRFHTPVTLKAGDTLKVHFRFS